MLLYLDTAPELIYLVAAGTHCRRTATTVALLKAYDLVATVGGISVYWPPGQAEITETVSLQQLASLAIGCAVAEDG